MIINNSTQRIHGAACSGVTHTQNHSLEKQTKCQKVKGKDIVALSPIAMDYTLCKQVLTETPDVREDRIAGLKALYETGELGVSSSDVAEKIVERFFEEI